MTPSVTRGDPPEQIANRYYDATTWIYRRAWGRSFHFAPLRRGESRAAAIRRYEREMADELRLAPSSLCLDLGCGVGGPAAAIGAATSARIVGLNANLGQLVIMAQSTLGRRRGADVRGVGADYGRLPFGADRFDAAYAFEALCHAVDLPAVFREVWRVLRPGGTLRFSEWCLTDDFRPDDRSQQALRRQIELSYGVVRLRSWSEWEAALLAAGFTIVHTTDRAVGAPAGGDDEAWYRALLPRDGTLDSLGRMRAVRALQATALALAERARLAPRGTAETVRLLRAGTAALVAAGRRGIFTPLRVAVATKRAVSTPASADS